nr:MULTISPECIES: DUF6160 family protein [unclassified Pseudomonas]
MSLRPLCLALLFVALPAAAELLALQEQELQQISGQAGLSLAADFNFAANPAQVRCAGGCGMRVAIRPGNSDGFVVLDNIRGLFSFDGVTLDMEKLDSGFDGDGAAFNSSVMRIGLANVRFGDFRFTLGSSNSERGSIAAGFRQTDLLTFSANGESRLQGNLYLIGLP